MSISENFKDAIKVIKTSEGILQQISQIIGVSVKLPMVVTLCLY